eukprot:365213-Chlamydomonas_euryale.AAC.15
MQKIDAKLTPKPMSAPSTIVTRNSVFCSAGRPGSRNSSPLACIKAAAAKKQTWWNKAAAGTKQVCMQPPSSCCRHMLHVICAQRQAPRRCAVEGMAVALVAHARAVGHGAGMGSAMVSPALT